MTRYELKKNAANAIVDFIEDNYGVYLCDVHDEVFNRVNYYESTEYEARDFFNDYEEDIFTVINEIINYENENFGEVNTSFGNALDVLNMFWYIIGEEVISELMDDSVLTDYWNQTIDDSNRSIILKAIKEKITKIF